MFKTVAEALDALGNTPEEVAQTLIAKGIKGAPRQAGYCPVANYLKGEGFPGASCWTWVYWDGDKVGTTPIPYHVHDFMVRFDAGEWHEQLHG